MKKTLRTEAQWYDLFEAQRQSGLSAAAFCRQNGLCPKHFSVRRRQLQVKTTQTSAFIKAAPLPTQTSAMQAIILKGPYGELRLPANISPQWLSALLNAVS